jgi:hypothetical protein
VTLKNHQRAVRYRQFAPAEPDRAIADLLLKLADEADRDVLCTSDWVRSSSPNGTDESIDARPLRIHTSCRPTLSQCERLRNISSGRLVSYMPFKQPGVAEARDQSSISVAIRSSSARCSGPLAPSRRNFPMPCRIPVPRSLGSADASRRASWKPDRAPSTRRPRCREKRT